MQALAQAAAPSKGEAFRNESIDGVRFVISGKYSPPSSGIFECDFVHLDAAPPRLAALSRAEFAEFNKQVLLDSIQILEYFIRPLMKRNCWTAASMRNGLGALGFAAADVQYGVLRRVAGRQQLVFLYVCQCGC